MMDEIKLTTKEKLAIKKLKELEDIWPDTLWLLSSERRLHAMRCGPHGEHVVTSRGDGFDSDYVVDTIYIDNDGGGR